MDELKSAGVGPGIFEPTDNGGPVAKKKAAKKKTSKKKASGKKKPGLWANIHKAQERAKKGGRPTRKKGQKGAPTDKAIKKTQKTTSKKKSRAKK